MARKQQCSGTTNLRFNEWEERIPTRVHLIRQGRDTYEQEVLWRGRDDELKDAYEYFKLQANLVKHM